MCKYKIEKWPKLCADKNGQNILQYRSSVQCILNPLSPAHGFQVVKAQLVDGLPSGYARFLLDLDGKSTTRRHGFKMEGTLTTKGCNNESKTRKFIL